MYEINKIAKKHNLYIVEDAVTLYRLNISVQCEVRRSGCFSFILSKFKRMGRWGIITTNDDKFNEKPRPIRNHGLKDRNTYLEFSYNSRPDSIQAVVAKHLIENKRLITSKRISNAMMFDSLLQDIPQIKLLKSQTHIKKLPLYFFC